MFTNILKKLLEDSGINQAELAQQADIPKTTINGWLKANRKPDYIALQKLSKFFNVSADYLLGLEDEHGEKYNIRGNIGHVFIKSNNNKVGDVGMTKEELKIIKKIIDKAANDEN